MGAKVGGKKKGGMDEINVTPLIDVVLVLLIIFMVLTPTTVQKMMSELPPKDDSPPPPPDPTQPRQLLIAVYKDNTYALNLQPMDDAKLYMELKQQLLGRKKDDKNVFVDGAPEAAYDAIVHAVDVARDAGAARVGFADLKEEGPAQLTPEQVLQLQSGTLDLSGGAAAPPAAPTP
jgi:biopolymer transport protein TolR